MTAADKLRELLATRPAQPGLVELVRWWQTSALLVTELLANLDDLGPAVGALFADRARQGDALDRERAAVDVLKQEVRELEEQRDQLLAEVERLKREHEADAQAFFDLKSDYGRACNERDAAKARILSEPATPPDDESRCAVCGWSMGGWPTTWGCKPGDCSMRPRPEKLYAPERAEREANDRSQRERMEAGHA